MSLPVLSSLAAPVPAQPDYGRALALRAMAAAYNDLPRYLLAPEIAALLHHVADWTQHALVNTLWNTGGRINEVLALRRRDFRLNEAIPHVVIRTAKQRRVGGGRPRKGKSANRVVPLSDPAYVEEMRRLFASTREEFETEGVTGERHALPVWSVSDRTVRKLAHPRGRRRGARRDPPQHRDFAARLPPQLRHAHALQPRAPKVLQSLLGHEKFESTEVYTKVFALDVAACQQVRFSLDTAAALEMLRGMPGR